MNLLSGLSQTKFMMMANRVKPLSVSDDGNGRIIVQLRKDVQVVHNYKKNDYMEIIFTEDQSHYQIGSESQLETIFRIHLSNKDFNYPAHMYCEKQLKKI